MTPLSPLSWIDPDSISDLASRARLVREGDPSGRTRTRTSLRALDRVARVAFGSRIEGEGAPEIAPRQLPGFQPPDAPLPARLNALIRWIDRALGCRRVFIADADGLPLGQRDCEIGIIGLSATLLDTCAQIQRTLRAEDQPWLTVRVAPYQTLHLLQVTLPWQRVSMGLLAQDEIRRADLELVREHLRASLADPATRETRPPGNAPDEGESPSDPSA